MTLRLAAASGDRDSGRVSAGFRELDIVNVITIRAFSVEPLLIRFVTYTSSNGKSFLRVEVGEVLHVPLKVEHVLGAVGIHAGQVALDVHLEAAFGRVYETLCT